MENTRDVARARWGDAQKIRSDIQAKISSLKERGNTNYTPRFEEVEQTMAEFRLACMQVIFHDFEYAFAKKVEHSLWQAHTLLNAEYRKVMSRLMGQNLVVEGRKLERLYRAFLKTSQLFYRGYIQRLSERFYIPELRQAAYGTDLESTDASSPDSSPPSELCALILKSCQITLVHLGDLARYRCQLSDKPKGDRRKPDKRSKPIFEQALEYYGLANIIDPDDGSAHHQLAVLYQLQGQHLDIVYHFHRAIAVAKPHELGLGNLEREFKNLENSSTARKGPVKDPSEAMISWFVRLHAFFFQGEQFSQQSELEEEVLHRVEIAMKSEGDEALLRKMILINIAAYDIAIEKVKAAWTMKGSKSCQFLLRFNIRTILVLLRLLKTALLDECAVTPVVDGGSNDDESTVCFSQLLLKLIPLFRVYVAWICVSGADIVKYQAYLEPYVRDVYRFLADTLTLLNIYIDQSHSTTSSKYLLPEDNEALGLRPFCDRELPLFHQPEGSLGSDLPRKHKVCKPRQQVFGRLYRPDTETVWRVRDIVFCGVILARSADFPVAITLLNHKGRDVEGWVYTDEAPQQAYLDEAGLSRILSKLKIDHKEVTPHDAVDKELDLPRLGVNTEDYQQLPFASHGGITSESRHQLNKGKAIEGKVTDSLPDSDVSEDKEMINMVNKLLDPDQDTHPQPSQTQAETSYGMNSSTANEIFGGLAMSTMQPSPVSKTIPNLPWDYFYTPTPHRSNSQGQNQFSSAGDYVPRSAHAQLRGFESSSYLNNLGASFQQVPKCSVPPTGNAQKAYGISGETMRHKSPVQTPGAPAPGTSQHDSARDSLEISRNAVLESLKSALFTQNGINPESRLGTSPTGPQRPTSGIPGSPYFTEANSPKMRGVENSLASDYMERSASQRATDANLHSSPGPPGRGRTVSKKGVFPGGSSGQSQNTTSPPSTAFGFPVPENQYPRATKVNDDFAAALFQHQYSPWLQEPTASGSSLAFSHPSSLYGGTPAGPPAAGPSHSVFSNGNYFNASTPFGRLGDGYNNREDPTHFRNQLKATLGNIDNSYDQQILQSALVDDSNKKRPK
ncbi:hypothetical protein F4779DRAFT_597832 [Xylariaceae sp. FL0662B]|nr:hypothetical protein F4779DRAFT_597832 [Xylariaceae sp. FL0662B]